MDTILHLNLLIQVEKISHAAAKCNMDFQTMLAEKESIMEVSDFLGITFDQAVLFSCLVELSLQKTVTLENLSRHLKCSVLKIIVIKHEIEALEKLTLLKKKSKSPRVITSYNEIGYSVPFNVIEALRTSDKSFLNPVLKLNFPNLLEHVQKIYKNRVDDTLTTKELIEEIDQLLANNKDHAFIKYINQKVEKTTNKCVVLVLAYYRLTGLVLMDSDNLQETIFDDIADHMEFRRTIASGKNEIIAKNIITMQHSDFANEQIMSLSQQSIKILYDDYPELCIQEISNNGLIKFDSIIDKQLYFNPELSFQINNITNVLGKKQFTSFQKAAKLNKLNTGITTIFYGYSGTGKTEAVYQIAKKTHRDIMMVDLSQTKSMWMGESEKQVKKIFDDYKQLLKTSSIQPILFINEVDGLFSKRQKLGNSSTSSSQTMNTIQNIILQALESFEGILFATTNLTENLDKAFERRFLFKVDFPKPDKNIRASIWKSKLPELTLKMAETLAERFELTGGQIDIQIRQLVLKKVLHKKTNVFESLLESCGKEKGFSERLMIGF
jgi:hypothetical protein